VGLLLGGFKVSMMPLFAIFKARSLRASHSLKPAVEMSVGIPLFNLLKVKAKLTSILSGLLLPAQYYACLPF
jgi:hypothetical protein